MRFPSLLAAFAITLAVLPLGCTKATVIGTPCMVDKDCNVKGQVCAPGFNGGASICTHACTANTGANGCPVGYDCYPTDAAKGPTCDKTLYEVDVAGNPLLIGVDCALSNDVCLNTGSTNSAPVCRKIEDPTSKPPAPVDVDPNAYCSGACTTDFDCPLAFACVTDYDMAKRCVRRAFCSSCVVDANCPPELALCVPTKDGTARYCTKSCDSTGDCGGVQNSAQTCAAAKSAVGADVKACLHRFGACVGKGNMCDPCRSDEDCAASSKQCILNSATSERFCSKRCTSDATCTATAGGNLTGCDNTDIATNANPNGQSVGVCNGDPTHKSPGLFSCWLPE